MNETNAEPGGQDPRAATARAHLDKLLKERTKGMAVFASLIGAAVALGVGFAAWTWTFAGLPRVPDAQALWTMARQPGVTFVDPLGKVLAIRGPYYGQAVGLAALPPHVPQAFLAIEDKRFYEHRGVDRQALARAAAANIGAGRTVQGGSTITQQLVKNLFLTPDRTVRRKLQEMILASRIERELTKDQILELYLNRIYLGDQAFGVDAAARRFFGKSASELTLPEAAMLAGLPKAPSRSAPTESFARAKERQALVLQAMVEAGFITEADRVRYAEAAIEVKRPIGEGNLGYALDMAMEEAARLGGKLPADLVVTLTIDPALQSAATRIVPAFLDAASPKGKPLQGALVALDRNGEVLALVGGTNYQKSKFNRATQALRQPGSTFKAFVYAAALEQGLGPETVRYDEPVRIRGWSPRNYGETYRGAVTLRTAFAQSLNTVAASVGEEIGQGNVAELAQRFGIRTALQPVPALALGVSEVTLFDMTQAFSVFMLEGAKIDAHLVLGVRDSRGHSLYARPPTTPQQIYDPSLAKQMNGMLGRVIQNGTGVRAQLRGRDVAGKTGTSQEWRDAWFVGYTHDFTAGVWVGYDDDRPMPRITGGGPPAEMWAEFVAEASKDIPATKLDGIQPVERPRRHVEMAAFYDALTVAFGGEPPPEPDPEALLQ